MPAMPTGRFRKFYFDACLFDYNKLREAMKPLEERLSKTGEIRLEGAQAYLVGEPGRGFVQMADMINNSRLSNGVRAAGLMALLNLRDRRCAALLAIALSKTYHKGAPVAVMDTEPAWDWLLPIFQAENVPLLRHKGRAFADMRQVHREAVDAGACVFVADSYGHPWGELQESLKKKLNVKKLEFHHQQELQELWGGWVREFLASPLHVLLAGRLAYEWENEVDEETGKMGFHKAGTKMRAVRQVTYDSSTKVLAQTKRRFWETDEGIYGGGTYTDSGRARAPHARSLSQRPDLMSQVS